MSEDLKYPIRYAVLELKGTTGKVYGFLKMKLGYIVQKCYVLKSSIEYSQNGEAKTSYEVVFPFKNINIWKLYSIRHELNYIYDIGEKNLPGYNYSYDIDIVSNVFESYEEASREADRKNKELMEDPYANLFLLLEKGKFRNIEIINNIKDFKEQLTLCQEFEKLVALETSDMEISREEDMKKPLQLSNKNKS